MLKGVFWSLFEYCLFVCLQHYEKNVNRFLRHYQVRLDREQETILVFVQYIPRNMHTVFALLFFVVVLNWLIFPYPPGLLHWHCGNLTIAPVPAKQPWWIWINTSCEFIMNDCITTTKQSTTKPCAYFLGYTVSNIAGKTDGHMFMGHWYHLAKGLTVSRLARLFNAPQTKCNLRYRNGSCLEIATYSLPICCCSFYRLVWRTCTLWQL